MQEQSQQYRVSGWWGGDAVVRRRVTESLGMTKLLPEIELDGSGSGESDTIKRRAEKNGINSVMGWQNINKDGRESHTSLWRPALPAVHPGPWHPAFHAPAQLSTRSDGDWASREKGMYG
ncbi:hypothetical protein Pcinc_015759 [Petrolisthes cinctipes]|uniref:Uncharacterized protein n=1 Tax=Petrolisthes cinctipes TaxID=88211 RepID=A0AAE1KPE6_PETCI|nr:hypothetical protein Pcinc_015759 [Petrolisthes cinctipes]